MTGSHSSKLPQLAESLPLQASQKRTCHHCKNFYVTWNDKHPYGCRALHVETTYLPSYHVRLLSGLACLYYEQKLPRTSRTKDPSATPTPSVTEKATAAPSLTWNKNTTFNKLT